VSTSAFYAWDKRPGILISADTLHLYRRVKDFFKRSRGGLGNREMVKKLRAEGYQIGRYKTRKIMAKLGLKVTQRVACKVTKKRKQVTRSQTI
jgi:putative transposase